MTKIERVRAALAGRPADRPPFTMWYHFGNQHASPERTAQVHLEYFAAYDFDLLKVMNDYDYPLPDGLDAIAGPADLARLAPFDVMATPLASQLRALELIAGALRGEALFLDTVFNAWNTMRRNLTKDAIMALMREHPKALERALSVVNDNLIGYARASLARGAAGIFLSVPASEEALTREQYERFMRPFDLAFLEAIRDMGEGHVLHAHGERVYLDRLLDYPVHALSWADRNGGPAVAEVRSRTGLTLMAGLDHVRFAEMPVPEVTAHVKAALAEGGATRFILAPGCSVPTYTYPPLIRAAVRAARG